MTPSALSAVAFVQTTPTTKQQLLRTRLEQGATSSCLWTASRKSHARAERVRPADARLRTHRCRSAAALAGAADIIDAAARRKGFAPNQCPTSAPAGGPSGDETQIEGVMEDGAPRRSSKRERSRLPSCKALRSWNRLAEKHLLRLCTTSDRRSAPAPPLPSTNPHRKRQERSSRPRLSVRQASRPRASPTSSRRKSSP